MKARNRFNLWFAPGALALALVVSGCATANVTYTTTGLPRNPVPVETVLVVEKVPYGSPRVANMEANYPSADQKAADANIAALKSKCAQLGGNRLIIEKYSIRPNHGYFMWAHAYFVQSR